MAHEGSLCLINSYSFQTPEAWTTEDEYRSLCYMRPLAIWAMQWALTRTNQPQPEPKPDVKEDGLFRYQAGFSRVANLLKVQEEEDSRSLLQIIFDYTCKRMLWKWLCFILLCFKDCNVVLRFGKVIFLWATWSRIGPICLIIRTILLWYMILHKRW